MSEAHGPVDVRQNGYRRRKTASQPALKLDVFPKDLTGWLLCALTGSGLMLLGCVCILGKLGRYTHEVGYYFLVPLVGTLFLLTVVLILATWFYSKRCPLRGIVYLCLSLIYFLLHGQSLVLK